APRRHRTADGPWGPEPDDRLGPQGAIDVCMMAPRQIETSSVCHRSKTRARSCRHRRVLAEHRGDLPPPVDPAQLDLPAYHEAEEQDQRGVLARQRAWVLTRRRNSSWSRSITF